MLVVKEFKIDKEADNFLKIVGREEGFISWLLSIFGISPITELICNRREVSFRTASLKNGNVTVGIPITSVTAIVSGYSKPFPLLVAAIVCFIASIPVAIINESGWLLLPGLLLGIIFIIMYQRGKKTIFGICVGGDKPGVASLITKRSVIEGKQITSEDFEEAAALLKKTVLDARTGSQK